MSAFESRCMQVHDQQVPELNTVLHGAPLLQLVFVIFSVHWGPHPPKRQDAIPYTIRKYARTDQSLSRYNRVRHQAPSRARFGSFVHRTVVQKKKTGGSPKELRQRHGGGMGWQPHWKTEPILRSSLGI